MAKIINIENLNEENLLKKGLTFLIINDVDKWKLSEEDLNILESCEIIEKYFDRHIYYFSKENNHISKIIFSNIKNKDPDNIKTFLCFKNYDNL